MSTVFEFKKSLQFKPVFSTFIFFCSRTAPSCTINIIKEKQIPQIFVYAGYLLALCLHPAALILRYSSVFARDQVQMHKCKSQCQKVANAKRSRLLSLTLEV